jgi:nucleoside-diphosphate-sugar epimerase
MEAEVLRGLSAGLKGTVLRVAGCIGPFDVKVGTSTLLVNAYQESLPFYVDGKINMVDVDEVARAHVEALKIESLKPVYTIAHHNTTVREFLELVSDRYGVRMPKRVPYFVAKPVTQIIERLAVRRRKRVRIPMEFIEMMAYGEHLPAPTRETGLIEFTTPLEESVARAVDWYVRHGFLKAKNENGKGSHGT